MPFGLNIAPRVFTKLTDTVVQELRRQGILVAAYLADWIVWAHSVEDCLKATKKALQFLDYLGFKVNLRKSRLTPSSNFEWLGRQWDLTSHRLSLQSKKRRAVAKQVRLFIRRQSVSRRDLERVLGSLQHA